MGKRLYMVKTYFGERLYFRATSIKVLAQYLFDNVILPVQIKTNKRIYRKTDYIKEI